MKAINGLINRRYGKLVVKSESEPQSGKRKWLCQCDCGTLVTLYESSFCRGPIKSCGCDCSEVEKQKREGGWSSILTKELLEKEHHINGLSLREIARKVGCSHSCVDKYAQKHQISINDKFYDLAGKKFQKLQVIDLAYTKNGNSYWNVECECGNKKTVQGKSIISARIVSCGCWNLDKCWKGCGELSKTYWSRIASHARDRGIDFNISIEFGWQKFKNQKGICALSGLPICLNRGYSQQLRNHSKTQTASLDRIDSTKHYTENNVQWVHVKINRMKSDLDEKDFIRLCESVTNFTNAADNK